MAKSLEDQIRKSHVSIMRSPQFCAMAGLVMMGSWRVEDNPKKCPTAYVNGRGERVYGREYFKGMTDKNVAYAVLHETGHAALSHLTVWKRLFNEDRMLANMAADYVVNLFIEDCDPKHDIAEMPVKDGKRMWLFDEQFRGWNVKQVFDFLKQNPPPQGGKGGGSGNGSGGMVLDEHDVDGDGDGGEPITPEEAEAIQKQVEEALRQGQYLASKMAGGRNAALDKMLQPQVDWREQLADFVDSVTQGDDEATWRRPMRRWLGEDIYLPSTISETVGELLVAPDMSGSVFSVAPKFLAEVKAICERVRPSKLHLVYWDDGIRRHETYLPGDYDNLYQNTKPTGGGGTDIGEVADLARKLPELVAAVILTDGYISGGFRTWPVPTLWCMTTDVKPPVGKIIKIEV